MNFSFWYFWSHEKYALFTIEMGIKIKHNLGFPDFLQFKIYQMVRFTWILQFTSSNTFYRFPENVERKIPLLVLLCPPKHWLCFTIITFRYSEIIVYLSYVGGKQNDECCICRRDSKHWQQYTQRRLRCASEIGRHSKFIITPKWFNPIPTKGMV